MQTINSVNLIDTPGKSSVNRHADYTFKQRANTNITHHFWVIAKYAMAGFGRTPATWMIQFDLAKILKSLRNACLLTWRTQSKVTELYRLHSNQPNTLNHDRVHFVAATGSYAVLLTLVG